MPPRNVRTDRASATREAILTAAERLFAEHGLFAVSHRQISEAAGQGNNAAVNYHFGTKTDLVRAILRKHSEPVEQRRAEMVAEVAGSMELRDWLTCLVRPLTEHLDSLGTPTWYMRFGAQLMADPMFNELMVEQSLSSPPMLEIVAGFDRCLPDMPAEVRRERQDMARNLIVYMGSERERALAEGTATPRPTWDEAATGLIDALVGLCLAPVTTRG